MTLYIYIYQSGFSTFVSVIFLQRKGILTAATAGKPNTFEVRVTEAVVGKELSMRTILLNNFNYPFDFRSAPGLLLVRLVKQ